MPPFPAALITAKLLSLLSGGYLQGLAAVFAFRFIPFGGVFCQKPFDCTFWYAGGFCDLSVT